jgi:hypothetical protein
MNQDTFKPFVQELLNAARPANEEAETKAQKSAALVVNSIGVHSTHKRTVHPSEFSKDAEFLGNALKAARDTKQPETPEAVKTLAELLAESAQDSEENE